MYYYGVSQDWLAEQAADLPELERDDTPPDDADWADEAIDCPLWVASVPDTD